MSISQPPIKEDPVEGAWSFEVVTQFNRLEQRFRTLLEAIQDATDLNDLKDKVEDI